MVSQIRIANTEFNFLSSAHDSQPLLCIHSFIKIGTHCFTPITIRLACSFQSLDEGQEPLPVQFSAFIFKGCHSLLAGCLIPPCAIGPLPSPSPSFQVPTLCCGLLPASVCWNLTVDLASSDLLLSVASWFELGAGACSARLSPGQLAHVKRMHGLKGCEHRHKRKLMLQHLGMQQVLQWPRKNSGHACKLVEHKL